MRLLLAAALISFATPVSAEQWYLVGGNDQTRTYVDLSSLRSLDTKIVGDILSVYATPVGDGEIYGAKIREEFDCSGKSFRTLVYTYYRQDGSFIESQASETINERKVPAANSINEAVMDFACYRTGGDPIADPFRDAASVFHG